MIDLIYTYNRMAAMVVPSARMKRRIAIITPSAKWIERAEQFSRWLKTQELPAGPYLASCFAFHKWTWAPKFDKLHEARYVRHYKNNTAEAVMWWRQLKIQQQAESAPDPDELFQGREIIKQGFRNDRLEKLCLAQPELSGGFHRLSEHCQTCPEKERCRARRDDEGARHK